MATSLLGEKAALALRYVLDYGAARQRALAHNLANTDTPGFKRLDVIFAPPPGAKDRAREPRSGAELTAPAYFREVATSIREDGNNVDPEVESARLASNALLFEASARLLAKRIQALRMVISEGRQQG